jgi:hypothetical protein
MMRTEMVLETSVSFIRLTPSLMTRTEMVLETSVYFIHLTPFLIMRTEMVLETSVSFIRLTRCDHPWWWRPRWSSKRRFLLFIWRDVIIPDGKDRDGPRNVGFFYSSDDIPDDEDRDGPRNVGFFYSSDAADWLRRFYWVTEIYEHETGVLTQFRSHARVSLLFASPLFMDWVLSSPFRGLEINASCNVKSTFV